MTVIAWDGRYLAADTRFSIGGTGIAQNVKSSKLLIFQGQVFAASGRIVDTHAIDLACWWQQGHEVAKMPALGSASGENFGNLIIPVMEIDQVTCWCVSYCSPYPWEMGPPAAWGSGADYAIGALECGADAMMGVRIACRHDHGCAEPIDFWDRHNTEAGIQRWER